MTCKAAAHGRTIKFVKAPQKAVVRPALPSTGAAALDALPGMLGATPGLVARTPPRLQGAGDGGARRPARRPHGQTSR